MFSIFIGAEYVHHQFPSDLPSQVIKALNATALGYWIIINILVAIIIKIMLMTLTLAWSGTIIYLTFAILATQDVGGKFPHLMRTHL